MSMAPKLVMRQSQTLVMTPQLLQAIKLLQLSTSELQAAVNEELERNPLLERALNPDDAPITHEQQPMAVAESAQTGEPGDWAREELPADRATLERETGTDFENTFPDEAITNQNLPEGDRALWNLSSGSGRGFSLDAEDSNLEAFCAAETTLHQHLANQLGCTDTDDLTRRILEVMIDQVDQTGYLLETLESFAARLGVPLARVELALSILQGFEPVGVGARSLAECLRLQLIENNRFDPVMAVFLDHLDLLAKREFVKLRKICNVDEEDLADMVTEIRRLDPKPGLVFAHSLSEPILPDVIVRAAAHGAWQVELNPDALPRVVANKTFYAQIVRKNQGKDKDKDKDKDKEKEARVFVEEAWANANWMVKSLEQRARTILKVASEIVRQQDGFFAYGIAHLRPLNLKTIADAVALHESTISRVTANKFMTTPRGLFEMKYFFTNAIASSEGGESLSAESVRFRIRQFIEAESAEAVLSDDAIVDKLKSDGIELARRTVAKYRESMAIASSAIRRREKMAASPRVRKQMDEKQKEKSE